MAIFLGNTEPQWPKSTMTTTGSPPPFPYYNCRIGGTNLEYLPGFSDDAAAGSAIKITYNSYGRGFARLDYVTKTGAAITDGVWNGGFTYAEVTDANLIAGLYMDDNDEYLYFLVINTSLAPDRYKLCKVDKEGVVTQSFGWTTPSGTSFDYDASAYFSQFGALYRTGGDGSGNFSFILGQATIGVDGFASPYLGTIMTFAASDGALTEATLVPDTSGGIDFWYAPSLGPTSNNIVGGLLSLTDAETGTEPGWGVLLNKSTGLGFSRVIYPQNFTQPHAMYYLPGAPIRWRGLYGMVASYYSYFGPVWYAEADIHTMLDEMAVSYGIL